MKMEQEEVRKPLFERLKEGLDEAVAYTRGEVECRTMIYPSGPPEIDGKTLAALRKRAGLSQVVFAKLLNVSLKTLQSWEQGIRNPSAAAQRLIQVFSQNPKGFCESLGIPPLSLEGISVRSFRGGRRKIVVDRLPQPPRPA